VVGELRNSMSRGGVVQQVANVTTSEPHHIRRRLPEKSFY
jgi:hypothetical protein